MVQSDDPAAEFILQKVHVCKFKGRYESYSFL